MKRLDTLESNPAPVPVQPDRTSLTPHKVFRPTRWLLLGGLILSFTGGLLILGLTLQRYYEIARFATATLPEDLAPGVNSAMMIGGPILVLGIATTIAGLIVWLVRRMLG